MILYKPEDIYFVKIHQDYWEYDYNKTNMVVEHFNNMVSIHQTTILISKILNLPEYGYRELQRLERKLMMLHTYGIF